MSLKLTAFDRREDALMLRDYLVSIGIECYVQPGFSGMCELMLTHADDYVKARGELLRFNAEPWNKRYRQAAWRRGRTDTARPQVRAKGNWFLQWNPLSFTSLVEIACVLSFILMQLMPETVLSLLGGYDFTLISDEYQIWRLLSPIFVHFNLMHLAFNLVMWEAFARPIEQNFGTLKLVLLTLGIALVSDTLCYVFYDWGKIFGGLSGVVYGIIGYRALLKLNPHLPYALQLPRGLLAVSMIFIGFSFFSSETSGLAHAGGLAAGAAFGLADCRRRFKL